MSPQMQMFITTCCANCKNFHCDGALFTKSRCDTWFKWIKLSDAERSRRFLAAMAGELTLLEEIVR
jgi:hypothetical protein